NDSAAPSPPTADFTANTTSGQAPLAVQFTDRSSGSITRRDWNFGDGSSHSSTPNPSHTYNNAGDYMVTLTVTGSGGSNSKSLTIHVTLPPAPANDSCAKHSFPTRRSSDLSGSNANATKESGEPNHAGNAGGSSIW